MNVRDFGDDEPEIHPEAYVDPDSTVIGDVKLKKDTSVWPGAVLRGDLEEIFVGPKSNLQDNVVCHADPGYPVEIGEACTIGHGAVVHGASIEDKCIVGMNATILNGADIGQKTIIAAGSVVTENESVPGGVLVAGSPAEVKTELDPDDDVFEAGNHYVDLAEIYSNSK